MRVEGYSSEALTGAPIPRLPPQALGDRDHRRFGRGVDGAVDEWTEAAVARGGVDDVALDALGQHGRHEGVDAIDDPHHVDVERPAPVVDVMLPDVAFGSRPDAGVVAHHVHGAIGVEGGVAECLDRRQIGDVGDDTDDLEALVPQLARGLVDQGGIDVGDHRLHPLTGEPFDERSPDASSSTRDHCDLAGDVFHCTLPLIDGPCHRRCSARNSSMRGHASLAASGSRADAGHPQQRAEGRGPTSASLRKLWPAPGYSLTSCTTPRSVSALSSFAAAPLRVRYRAP